MKESLLEKLIELLNEYHFKNTDCVNYVLDEEENRIYLKEEFDGFYHEQRINDERIISKKFGFIKRLVENDKIDRDKFEEIYEEGKNEARYIAGCNEDEMIIMLLSISDTPIDDLILYLK